MGDGSKILAAVSMQVGSFFLQFAGVRLGFRLARGPVERGWASYAAEGTLSVMALAATLFALVLFVRVGRRYAVKKGWPSWVGWTGVFGLLGLLFLWQLPVRPVARRAPRDEGSTSAPITGPGPAGSRGGGSGR